MTRSVLASLFAAGLTGAFLACLPELSALNGASDAGDAGDAGEGEETGASSACGDGFIDDDAGEVCDPGQALATSTTCINCAVQCTGGNIDPESGHCYFIPNVSATFAQAAEACTGGHVVTITSDREAAFVDGLTKAPYWVGAQFLESVGGYRSEVTTEPGFPADGGCAGCYDRRSGATAVDGGGDCVLSSDGGWTLVPCNDAGAATICEREPQGNRSIFCGGPYCSAIPFTLGKKRYLVYLENAARDAAGAARECARYDGGRLVVFDSREEREQLAREVLALGVLTPFTAWIGVVNDGGAWAWDDGQPVDDAGRPSPWGAAQPSVNTGRAFIRIGTSFIDSQLAQANADDATPRPFICERK